MRNAATAPNPNDLGGVAVAIATAASERENCNKTYGVGPEPLVLADPPEEEGRSNEMVRYL